MPIAGIVHVGAGAGLTTSCYADWEVESVVLIEAEEGLHDRLAAIAQKHPRWSAYIALVSDSEEEKDFYLADNPNESGVLAPERLAGFWRNLKTEEQRRVNATTLDHLLTASSYPPETINWAVIDCLPALPVMHGAGRYLQGLDVIVARVVLDESQLPGVGAAKTEIDAFLSTHGYRCLAWEEERQPAIGRVLYIRDWKASFRSRLTELQGYSSKQARLAAERQKQVDQLSKARDEQKNLLEQAAKARDEQARLAAERLAQLDQATKAAAEHKQQLDLASKARNEQARLAAELQKQVDQLSKARDEQKKLAHVKQLEIDKLATLLQETQSRIVQLDSQLAEKNVRERLLNEEMTKAENQLELLKDILLREAGI
jgi:FkbM family methyltransferase